MTDAKEYLKFSHACFGLVLDINVWYYIRENDVRIYDITVNDRSVRLTDLRSAERRIITTRAKHHAIKHGFMTTTLTRSNHVTA